MSYPKHGTYQAIVTDNSEFYKRGHIRVRVSTFYSGNINWNLSDNYNETKFKKNLIKDIRCYIFTPIGGGSGHGMFSLPQVNSIGVVSFLDGDIKKAVWLGSFVNPQFDEDGNFVKAASPNDTLEKEGYGYDGVTVDGKNVESDGGAIIIRQKSTTSEDADSMNWNKNRTENLVVMSKDDLTLTHITKWKESEDKSSAQPIIYHEISISKDTDDESDTKGLTSISVKSFNINDNHTLDEFGLEIINQKVKLKTVSEESKITNNITMSKDDIVVKSYDDNTQDESEVTINPTELFLKNKEANIDIKKDEVNIFANKKITLSGKDIRLGGMAEEYVVTTNRIFSFRMEDGTIMTSSSVARA